MGSENFLQDCCWQRRGKLHGGLYGIPDGRQKRCSVVGFVAAEGLMVGPTGNFSVNAPCNMEDAHRELYLLQPHDVPGFEGDFLQALENTKQLRCVVPGNGPMGDFLSEQGGEQCFKFKWRVFEKKVSLNKCMPVNGAADIAGSFRFHITTKVRLIKIREITDG